MEIGEYLPKFTVHKAKSDAQQRVWERADAVTLIMEFLHRAEDTQLTAHLEPHEMIAYMDYAKKHGDKPKAFFRYLIAERKKQKYGISH